ncbi:MAG: hypothetical protein WCQ26_07825, partial [Pseudanabaena sp. ELA748]
CRAQVLVALGYVVSQPLFDQVANAIQVIKNQYVRAMAFSLLSELLPDRLSEIFKMAQAILEPFERAKVLAFLSHQIPQARSESLKIIPQIENIENRFWVQLALANRLSEENILSAALDSALAIPDERQRSEALIDLVEILPSHLIAKVLKAALEMKKYVAHVLRELPNKLPESYFSRICQILLGTESRVHLDEIIEALADVLPEELLPQTLKVIEKLDAQAVPGALNALRERLSDDDMVQKAFKIANAIQSVKIRAEAFDSIAYSLPQELLRQAFQSAGLISDGTCVQLQIALSRQCSELLPGTLRVVQAIEDNLRRTKFLVKLADLNPEAHASALESINQLDNECDRANALCKLALKCPEDLQKAIEAAPQNLGDTTNTAILFGHMAYKIPTFLQPLAVQICLEISSEADRARALCSLIPFLSGSPLDNARLGAEKFEDFCCKAQVLVALEIRLPNNFPQALQVVLELKDDNDYWRTDLLSQLIPNVSTESLSKILAVIPTVNNASHRAKVWVAIAIRCPEYIPQALESISVISNEGEQVGLLIELGQKQQQVLNQAYQRIQAIQDLPKRASYLIAISDQKAEAVMQALMIAKSVGDPWKRLELLNALAPFLSQLSVTQLSPLWSNTLKTLATRSRSDLLEDLAPFVPVIQKLGGQSAVKALAESVQSVSTWWR